MLYHVATLYLVAHSRTSGIGNIGPRSRSRSFPDIASSRCEARAVILIESFRSDPDTRSGWLRRDDGNSS